jgi:hypothetical protein
MDTKPKSSPKETARNLVQEKLITSQSEDAIRSLQFLANIGNYVNQLQYRLACTMFVCNKLGIMACRTGGGKNDKTSSIMQETQYRKSKSPSGEPTVNMPSSVIALSSQAQVNFAAPGPDDTTAVSEVRHVGYSPYVTGRKLSFYRQFSGPPLAPQNEQSRVVTNYVVSIKSESETGFTAEGKWSQVKELGKYGEQNILDRHFDSGVGEKKTTRDLRGATQYEMDQIKRQIDLWVKETARNLI